MPETVPLWDVSQGVRGLASARDSASHQPGDFLECENFRLGFRSLAMRKALQSVSLTLNPGLAFPSGSEPVVGSEVLRVNGADRLYTAFDDGSHVLVYQGLVTTGAMTLTEASAASGKHGDTRMATGRQVAFAVVRDCVSLSDGSAGTKDLVLVSNGKETRIHDAAAGTFAVVASGPDYRPGSCKSVFGPLDEMSLTTANTSVASTGGFTCVDNAAHPDTGGTTLRARMAVGTAAGDTGTFTFTAGLGPWAAHQTQLQVVYDSPQDRTVWNVLQVEVQVGGTAWRTLHNPVGAKNFPIVTLLDKGFSLASFPLDTGAAGVVRPTETVTGLRLTYRGASAVTATTDVYIIGVLQPGNYYCGSAVGVSYWHTDARSETRGIVADDGGGKLLSPQDARNAVRMPRDPRVQCAYYVSYFRPVAAVLQAGWDKALFHVSPPGSSTLTFKQAETQTTYSGSWSTAGQGERQTAVLSHDSVDVARTMPGAFHEPVPHFTTAASMNNRLFVGGGSSQKGSFLNSADVWVSEEGSFWRFSPLIEYDDFGNPSYRSATRASAPGSTVRKVEAPVAGDGGPDRLLVWTDRSFGVMTGEDALSLSRVQSVSPNGTDAPQTVCQMGGYVYWLDSNRKIVRFGPGGLQDLSTGSVSDKLTSLTKAQCQKCSAAQRYGFIYFFLPEGSAMDVTTCLVFNDEVGGWSLDTYHSDYEFYFARENSDQVLVWGTAGNLYRYDHASNNLDAGLRRFGGRLTVGGWPLKGFFDRFQFGGPQAVCDPRASSTLTMTLRTKPFWVDSVTTDAWSGQASVAASSAAYGFAEKSVSVRPQTEALNVPAGYGCLVTVSCDTDGSNDWKANWRLYAVGVDVSPVGTQGASAR